MTNSTSDQAGRANDAAELADELAAHLHRLARLLEAGTLDFEARTDIGQDVLELTESLRTYAVYSFLGGVL